MRTLIHDLDEVRHFYDFILPILSPSEVYFLSLSARNKYLTAEERVEFDLGRTEMFERRVVRERDWNKFYRTLRKFECHDDGYLTKNGKPIPPKSVICYININPSDVFKAYKEFSNVMNEYMFELSQLSMNNRSTENLMPRMRKMELVMMNAFQHSRGAKHYLDVDFDVPKDARGYNLLLSFLGELTAHAVQYHVIDTKSGYHVLLKRDTVKFNFPTYLRILETGAREKISDKIEIVVNDNEMIPLPGTLQGEYPVRILKDI
jgi:hypothetical protein